MNKQKRLSLKVILLSKVRDLFGFWELCITINDKQYTYYLSSEFGVRQFEKKLYKKMPGKALQVLRKFNHKEVKV